MKVEPNENEDDMYNHIKILKHLSEELAKAMRKLLYIFISFAVGFLLMILVLMFKVFQW